jgi:uncharacterized OB-fold protein
MTTPSPRRIDDRLAAAPVFEEDGEEVRLLGSTCGQCGAVAFPRRVVCIRCGAPQQATRLSGRGRLHSWTLLANPPYGFEGEVYYGCVDLVEGPRILAVLGDEEPHIGAFVGGVPARVRHQAVGFRFEVCHA